ncbi:unnamed protein product [Ectocarpus fasciculatus]
MEILTHGRGSQRRTKRGSMVTSQKLNMEGMEWCRRNPSLIQHTCGFSHQQKRINAYRHVSRLCIHRASKCKGSIKGTICGPLGIAHPLLPVPFTFKDTTER